MCLICANYICFIGTILFAKRKSLVKLTRSVNSLKNKGDSGETTFMFSRTF